MSSVSYIQINDIFEEISEENKSLSNELMFANKCLNILIRFKSFVDIISDKFKTNLDSNYRKTFEDLNKEVQEVIQQRNSKNIIKTANKTNSTEYPIKSDPKTSISKTILKNKIKTETTDNKHKKIISVINEDPFDDNSFKEEEFDDYSPANEDQFEDSSSVNEEQFDNKSVETNTVLNGGTKRRRKRNIKQEINGDNESVDPTDRIVCEYVGCGRHYATRNSMKEHYKKHFLDKSHKCPFIGCDYRTWNRSYFEAHTNAHEGIKPHVCPHCAKGFTAKKLLGTHVKLTHILPNEPLICDIDNCNKQFKNIQSFRIHQKMSHLLEKKLCCDEPNCDFRCVNSYQMKHHINYKHSTERPFDCTVKGCRKTFKRNNDMLRHIQTCHSTERNFKCTHEGCHKTFKESKELKKHESYSHTDVKIGCDWPGCDFETSFPSSLRSHQLVHSSDRNFVCDWPHCHKTFKRKPQLIVHLRIHNCEKPYACHWPGCQYRCVDSANINKHLRVHRKSSNYHQEQ